MSGMIGVGALFVMGGTVLEAAAVDGRGVGGCGLGGAELNGLGGTTGMPALSRCCVAGGVLGTGGAGLAGLAAPAVGVLAEGEGSAGFGGVTGTAGVGLAAAVGSGGGGFAVPAGTEVEAVGTTGAGFGRITGTDEDENRFGGGKGRAAAAARIDAGTFDSRFPNSGFLCTSVCGAGAVLTPADT